MAWVALQDLCPVIKHQHPSARPSDPFFLLSALRTESAGLPLSWSPRRTGCPGPPTACSQPSANPGSQGEP